MKKSELITAYKDYLILKNYRPQTSKTYLKSIDKFLDYCIVNASYESKLSEYASKYLIYRFKDGKSWSSVNIDYSAIRLLFIHILRLDWDYQLIPRPRGRASLPSILSGRQIERIVNSIRNLKHKTIVVLLYSTGIRINELIQLDVAHILMDRKQLKIAQGKGGKDRLIFIPDITLHLLKYYMARYNPSKSLIEGLPKGKRYSSSSIRKILDRAALKAGIPFKVNPHALRHAYATHHIENGTDLVILQQQLGHKDIETTIKYVKLCKLKNRHINHPIQRLKILLPDQTT